MRKITQWFCIIILLKTWKIYKTIIEITYLKKTFYYVIHVSNEPSCEAITSVLFQKQNVAQILCTS